MLLQTFGLALKAYLLTWSGVFASQPSWGSDGPPGRGLCLCSVSLSPPKCMCLPGLSASALRQQSAQTLRQPWLTQIVSHGITHRVEVQVLAAALRANLPRASERVVVAGKSRCFTLNTEQLNTFCNACPRLQGLGHGLKTALLGLRRTLLTWSCPRGSLPPWTARRRAGPPPP